jgi:hypothetical protein
MKSIVLCTLLAVSASAAAQDLQSIQYNTIMIAADVCLTHAYPRAGVPYAYAGNLDDPKTYQPGFGSCAPLVSKWIYMANKRKSEWEAKQKATEAERAAAQEVKDKVTINQGLQLAGLPLISE